jgi:hypothetical protein
MELLLSVISLALAIYERMERQAEKRRSQCSQLAESDELCAPFDSRLFVTALRSDNVASHRYRTF